MKTYIRLSGRSRATTAVPSVHSLNDWPRYERQAYFSRPVKGPSDVQPEAGAVAAQVRPAWQRLLSPLQLLRRALFVTAAAGALTGNAFSETRSDALTVGAMPLSMEQLQYLVGRMTLRQTSLSQAQRQNKKRTVQSQEPAGLPAVIDTPETATAATTEGRKPLTLTAPALTTAPSADTQGSVVVPAEDNSSGGTANTGNGTVNNATAAGSGAKANTPAAAPAANMPEIRFTAVDGREVDLASLRGKVVLIDFWATWCGPCMSEIPNVVAAYKQYHDQGFEIIGISFDTNKVTLQRVTEDKGMPWPQYFDGKGWDNDFGVKFGIHGIPTMWLIDQEGRLVTKNARTDLAGQVGKLLEKQ